jgi:uncharacterized phage-associated protein
LPPRSHSETLADEITLLILLKALADLGMTTRRVKLQKLTYFANVLASILGQRLTHHEFFVFKYGPFSKQLYSDIEVLVTRDLVKATPVGDIEEDEKSFEYEIKAEGISKVKKALQSPEFAEKHSVILKTLQAVGDLTTNQIRDLSYGELNFRKAREKGITTVIDPSYPLCLESKRLAIDVAQNEFGIHLSDEDASLMYLELVRALAG